jgi:hypothetical protein
VCSSSDLHDTRSGGWQAQSPAPFAHCHPPYATAFAITGTIPPNGLIPEYEIFIGVAGGPSLIQYFIKLRVLPSPSPLGTGEEEPID